MTSIDGLLTAPEYNLESAAWCEAAVGVGVIDIFEPLDKSRRDPPGQCGEGVGEGVRARPANALE